MSIDVLQAIAQAQASWQPPQVPEDIPQGDMPGDKVWIGPQSIERPTWRSGPRCPCCKKP
jgi:hypothetical protein